MTVHHKHSCRRCGNRRLVFETYLIEYGRFTVHLDGYLQEARAIITLFLYCEPCDLILEFDDYDV